MYSKRKERIRAISDAQASKRADWINKNIFYYEDERKYLRYLVPEGQRILELGCGTGQLLNALNPREGIGIDISGNMIAIARKKYSHLRYIEGDFEDPEVLGNVEGTFDAVIMSETIGFLDDCQATLELLHSLCNRDTRVIIANCSSLWEPVLKLAAIFNLKMSTTEQNWLSTDDIIGLCELADFEFVQREWRQLIPKRLFGLGTIINRLFAHLPLIRYLCLRHYVIFRSARTKVLDQPSVSVVIPCRNEQGNIRNTVKRMPRFCDDLEILFVEGNSQDDTWGEIQKVSEEYKDWNIKALRQDGIGKGDAVRKGFEQACGDILMILDGDLTVPPESLPKFYEALRNEKGDFIMGSRLVYPVEHGSMRFLNYWANNTFAAIFSWLLNQRVTDTLCGTKVLRKSDYEKIARNRSYFGNLDPFGDFDLIFGACKLSLKIVELPIRYSARKYGDTQISRFRHGWILLKMVFVAFNKMKLL